jgi:hypothetical protein
MKVLSKAQLFWAATILLTMTSSCLAVDLDHQPEDNAVSFELRKDEPTPETSDVLLVQNSHSAGPTEEQAKLLSHANIKKSGPYLSLANSIISTHKTVKNFIKQIGHGFQETMTESATRNRAIYIFIAVVFMVVLCCVGLQFILSMAKSSRINLNKLEKLMKQKQEDLERQQSSVDSDSNGAAAERQRENLNA